MLSRSEQRLAYKEASVWRHRNTSRMRKKAYRTLLGRLSVRLRRPPAGRSMRPRRRSALSFFALVAEALACVLSPEDHRLKPVPLRISPRAARHHYCWGLSDLMVARAQMLARCWQANSGLATPVICRMARTIISQPELIAASSPSSWNAITVILPIRHSPSESNSFPKWPQALACVL